jgi:hypothetical protein
MMAGRANDQGFASLLEHDLGPVGSIFSHAFEGSQCLYLVDHPLLVFEGTEFTDRCQEPSFHLLLLVTDDYGSRITQDSFAISSQSNTAKAGE